MFGRKVDPSEREDVLGLMGRWFQATATIDQATDAMKSTIARLGMQSGEFEEARLAALEVVNRVRTETAAPHFWPILVDKTGARILIEFQQKLHESYAHQLNLLNLYRIAAAAFRGGREDQAPSDKELTAANNSFAHVLDEMGRIGGKLAKHYRISGQEYQRQIQLGEKKTDYLKDAIEQYDRNVGRAAESPFEYSLWSSWGFGAYQLLLKLREMQGFGQIPDTPDTARRLLELGMQPMISFWCHNREEQEPHSEEEKGAARDTAFRNIQVFLGGKSSEDSVRVAMHLDVELQQSFNERRNSSAYYVGMFCKRYWECVTDRQIVDWGRLVFPIETYKQFLQACNTNEFRQANQLDLDPMLKLEAWAAITDSGKFMFDKFRELHQTRKGSEDPLPNERTDGY